MSMQRYDDKEAESLLYAHASTWEWMVKGYGHDTDVVVLQGTDDKQYRFLLCHHPVYMFYGERYSAGRGYIIRDEAEVENLLTPIQPSPIDTAGTCTLALGDDSELLKLLLRCRTYTLYLQDGEPCS